MEKEKGCGGFVYKRADSDNPSFGKGGEEAPVCSISWNCAYTGRYLSEGR